MSTDAGYIPKTKVFQLTESLKVIETRGIWEVKDQFMAGPFLNHSYSQRQLRGILYFRRICLFSRDNKKGLYF